jgi:hypothetical protein
MVSAPRAVCSPSLRHAQSQVFPVRADQIRAARSFLAAVLEGLPVADDAVLCLSELATNSVLHSDSRRPGGTFTVCVDVHPGDHVRFEVHDAGGAWTEHPARDGRPHGLDIVRALAADCGIDGNALTGWIVWARLDWPSPGTTTEPTRASPNGPLIPSPPNANQATQRQEHP